MREGFSLGAGVGACSEGRGSLDTPPQQPHGDQFLRGLAAPVCGSEKRKAPGSDGVVTEVLYSELGVSGQSQVLRTETFCCLLTEYNQKKNVYTSFSNLALPQKIFNQVYSLPRIWL